ncbi:MreB/Mrl family cell shape determining protein [Patescibacteria group bacterium]|nr:MreB/Mrl family cell shape determining protein [Patescibacteria group bacterium]
MLSHDIGIDLGTANTLVYVKGVGIVINEPSVVALNEKTGQVVAVGRQAKHMLGRTPQHIRAVRPLVDGVISDFEVAEEMLSYLIAKAQRGRQRILGPRVVIGVPSGITNVEVRAVRDAAKNAGARDIHIVEEPMAAAIGARLPVTRAGGNMVIDIGGGTTDVAIISLAGVVEAQNIKIAGDHLNEAIISYIKDEFKILIGDVTAEELKFAVCSVEEQGEPLEATIRGRDVVTGLPREVVITDTDVREAIIPHLDTLMESLKAILESTPPEILGDVMQRGVIVTGGGALIPGMPELIEMVLGVPASRVDDPLTTVVRGTGTILDHFEEFRDILIKHDDQPVVARAGEGA